MYIPLSVKRTVYKTAYLVCSLGVLAYGAAFLVRGLLRGFAGGLAFSDLVDLFARVFALLFEGTVIGFIIRSYRRPTVLIKNLVFKPDGSVYRPGLFLVCAGTVLMGASAGAFLWSAHVRDLFPALTATMQSFIAAVSLIMLVNLLFAVLFYFVFRREAGVFDII